jgi:hypothetical protein
VSVFSKSSLKSYWKMFTKIVKTALLKPIADYLELYTESEGGKIAKK